MAAESTKAKPKWNVMAIAALVGSLLWVPICAYLALKDGTVIPAAISTVVSMVLGLVLGTLAKRQINDAPSGAYRGYTLAILARLFGWFALLATACIVFWIVLPDGPPPPAP